MSDRRGTWTEEADAVLARLWADGETTGTIAAHFEKTRNAVIGRAHRIGLPPRPSPIPGYVPKPPPPRPQVDILLKNIYPVAPVPLPGLPRLPGVNACQYPHGDPRTPQFRYCEAAIVGAGPYCPTHHALCWLGRARTA